MFVIIGIIMRTMIIAISLIMVTNKYTEHKLITQFVLENKQIRVKQVISL